MIDPDRSIDQALRLLPNIALSGTAYQSSNYRRPDKFSDEELPMYAIDGIFKTDILGSEDARCAMTQPEAGSWWQVDLGDFYWIEKVAITTRKAARYVYLLDWKQ